MPNLTFDDLKDRTPLEVFDANGQRIKRAIVEFDTQSGIVVSDILDSNGRPVLTRDRTEIARRTEQYAAPLYWKSIPREHVRKDYWDVRECPAPSTT